MKNHRFPWLRNRTTDNRKCEKARNIKEKRTIEMFNTVLKQLVELLSSQRDNRIPAIWLYTVISKSSESCLDNFWTTKKSIFDRSVSCRAIFLCCCNL